ncbi:MAG: hypothetical protein HY782_21080 [Chloroflexi bacterium]|nr:hypothetical protein [Chloroflexota bacterium]
MKALVFDGTFKLVHDYPLPRVPEGESLVRVTRAGIGNADLEIVKGYMGFREITDRLRVRPTDRVCVIGDGKLGLPVVIDEISIVGSRCGPFAPALRLLEKALIDVDSLVSAEFPIERGIEAFQCAATPGIVKTQVIMR